MAIDGYVTPQFEGCIDNAAVEQTFSSIAALKDAAERGSFRLQCEPVDVVIEGSEGVTSSGEVCQTIFEDTQRQNVDGREKCIYLLTYSMSFDEVGSADGRIDVELDYVFKCGNRVIGQGSAMSGIVSGVSIVADCDIGEDVQVCVSARLVQTGTGGGNAGGTGLNNINGDGGGGFRANWRLRFCGGRVCIREFNNAPNCWVPCLFEEGCCYGMEALALIIDAVNDLCASYSFGGQAIQCISLPDTVVDPANPVLVQGNLPTNTTWIAFASIQVCYTNFDNLDRDDRFVLTPVIGCGEGETCLTAVIRPKGPTSQAIFRNSCERVPFMHCGECLAGDSLYIGGNAELICDAPDVEGNPPNVDVMGDWCIWLFSDITNDLGNNIAQIDRCLSQEQLDLIPEKLDVIHTAACNRIEINCTRRTATFEVPVEEHFVIQEPLPLPNPPPDPLPVPWPPKKKWFIFGSGRVCLDSTVLPEIETTRLRRAWIEIKCGGVTVFNGSSEDCVWEITGSGQQQLCSPVFNIAANVECDIDQPLQICAFEAQAGAFGGLGGPWVFEGEVTAICF